MGEGCELISSSWSWGIGSWPWESWWVTTLRSTSAGLSLQSLKKGGRCSGGNLSAPEGGDIKVRADVRFFFGFWLWNLWGRIQGGSWHHSSLLSNLWTSLPPHATTVLWHLHHLLGQLRAKGAWIAVSSCSGSNNLLFVIEPHSWMGVGGADFKMDDEIRLACPRHLKPSIFLGVAKECRWILPLAANRKGKASQQDPRLIGWKDEIRCSPQAQGSWWGSFWGKV